MKSERGREYANRSESGTTFLFADGHAGRRDLLGAIAERGGVLTLVTLMFLLIGSFGLYMWSQREPFWHPVLAIALVPILWAASHFLGLVVEVRVTPQCLSFRRLVRFRSLPWAEISRVRVYSLRATQVTYVRIVGRSGCPSAFFPLWVPVYRPETWDELDHLVKDIARRVPVKHTW